MKKKVDFKKLALLGIATGSMIATQGTATETVDSNSFGNLLAFAGCSNNGCSNSPPPGPMNRGKVVNNSNARASMPAPAPVQPMNQSASTNSQSDTTPPANMAPSQGMNPPQGSYYYRDSNQGAAGCASAQSPQNSYSNNSQQQMRSAGCASPQSPQNSYSNNQQPQMRSAGCASPQNSYSNNQQPQMRSAGCGASSETAYNAPQSNNSWRNDASVNQDLDNRPMGPSSNMSPNLRSGSPQTSNSSQKGWNSYTAEADVASGNMTEGQLLSQLNDQGKATYQGLDSAGKALALKLANSTCKGNNDCKGLNSCKTEKNSCAGMGSCAHTQKGPFTDKNLAVKVAAKKMAEKRSNVNSR